MEVHKIQPFLSFPFLLSSSLSLTDVHIRVFSALILQQFIRKVTDVAIPICYQETWWYR